MSLTQQLLLRALVARFWKKPYRPGGSSAGAPSCTTASCCRFRLAGSRGRHRRDLPRRGYRVAARVVRAAFRVPLPALRRLRRARRRGRAARTRSSPGTCWARKARAGGTVRYVDSSLERLQVKASGLVDERHVLTCNGRARAAAADRQRRASSSPACATAPGSRPRPASDHRRARAAHLRPRRHVDEALARRLPVPRRAPGRPRYDTFPVNAYEAEGRRLARFFTIGHTPGRVDSAPPSRATRTSRSRSTFGG